MKLSLRDEALDAIDSQISVDGKLFLSDLRWLAMIPVLPFMGAAFALFEPGSTSFQMVFGLGILLAVPWTVFLFRRHRLKKARWVEPTRFSDDRGPY